MLVKPLVTAVCSTYCRPQQLAEALWCFLSQDYQNKELVILNDAPYHQVALDKAYDNVRVINTAERFGSLGEKRNFGLSFVRGEYYLLWEDDDLSLRWRISESVNWLESHDSYNAVNPISSIYSIHNADYAIVTGNLEGQACFHSSHFESARYPTDKSVEMDLAFQSTAALARPDVKPHYWYIYRWGLNVWHLSGRGEDSKEVWEEAGVRSEELCGEMPIIAPATCVEYFVAASKFLRVNLDEPQYRIWQKAISTWIE